MKNIMCKYGQVFEWIAWGSWGDLCFLWSAFDDHGAEAGDGDGALVLIADFDVPVVEASAEAQRCSASHDPAGTYGSQVADVEFDAHGLLACHVVDAQHGGHAADGFGESCRGTAVQNARRLTRAMIDRHARLQIIITHLGKDNAQGFDEGAVSQLVEDFDIDGSFPDTHTRNVLRSVTL